MAAAEGVPEVRLVAYVVVEGQTSEEDLRAFLQKRLSPAAVPARSGILPSLPLTASGKVASEDLPPPCWGQRSAASTEGESIAPGSPFLSRAVAAFSRALAGDSGGCIAVDADFFHEGASSMSAALVAVELGVRMEEVYRYRTAATMAAALRQRHGQGETGGGGTQQTLAAAADENGVTVRSLGAPSTSGSAGKVSPSSGPVIRAGSHVPGYGATRAVIGRAAYRFLVAFDSSDPIPTPAATSHKRIFSS